MRFMLDTNICIYIIKRKPAQVLSRFQTLEVHQVGISAITLSELEYGIAKSSNRHQNSEALMGFLAPLEIVPYNDLAAYHYGEIRAYLEVKGHPIGAMDLLIGAHARSLSVPLVTNNVREFSVIPGLSVENWIEP
jgi:tRNA(fMet)-specific endonuclease VapC